MIPRSKVTSNPENGNEVHERYSPTYAELFNVPYHIGDSISWFKGYDIKRYHKRLRSGSLLPFTTFEQYSLESKREGSLDYTYTPSSTSYRTSQNWSHPSGSLSSEWSLSSGLMASKAATIASEHSINQFVTDAAAQIYNTGWDGLTFAAELRKTISLFTGLRTRFLRLMQESSKIGMANAWLEYRYGWRILYYDMKDITNLIQNLDDSRKRYSQRNGKTIQFTEIDTAEYDGNYKFTYTNVKEFEVSMRGAVVADINPPDISFNPVLTAWETIKWSFIVDWFVGVGSWLASLSTLTLASSYTASTGIKINATATGTLQVNGFNTGYTGTLSAKHFAESTYVIRRPSRIPPYPSIRLNVDYFKAVDVLALIASFGDKSGPGQSHRR